MRRYEKQPYSFETSLCGKGGYRLRFPLLKCFSSSLCFRGDYRRALLRGPYWKAPYWQASLIHYPLSPSFAVCVNMTLECLLSSQPHITSINEAAEAARLRLGGWKRTSTSSVPSWSRNSQESYETKQGTYAVGYCHRAPEQGRMHLP